MNTHEYYYHISRLVWFTVYVDCKCCAFIVAGSTNVISRQWTRPLIERKYIGLHVGLSQRHGMRWCAYFETERFMSWVSQELMFRPWLRYNLDAWQPYNMTSVFAGMLSPPVGTLTSEWKLVRLPKNSSSSESVDACNARTRWCRWWLVGGPMKYPGESWFFPPTTVSSAMHSPRAKAVNNIGCSTACAALMVDNPGRDARSSSFFALLLIVRSLVPRVQTRHATNPATIETPMRQTTLNTTVCIRAKTSGS